MTPTGPAAPPQNLEAEVAVLGAILLSDRALYALVIEEGLAPSDFYRLSHGEIYQAMLDLHATASPVDVMTVTQRLTEKGKLEELGGRAAIDGLAGPVPNVGHVREYARIVKDTATLRRVLAAAHEMQQVVFAPRADAREVVEKAERLALGISKTNESQSVRRLEEILVVELSKLEDLANNAGALTGLATGFHELDEITGGLQPGNLIVVAARPSMGKSQLVANIAEHVALKERKGVLIFSLEMSESELAQRFIASQASVPGDAIRRGRIDAARWPKVLDAAKRLSGAPILIDDSADISVTEIRAKARRLAAEAAGDEPLGLVVVDYLQLLRPEDPSANRVEQVGQMSRGLKILARELKLPVIALSQLNRGLESRTDKRPLLSDLRDSGQVEQDADVVAFIYRDEVYNKDSEQPGEAELIISKHRNGRLDTVPLVFLAQYPKFVMRAHAT